MSVSSPFTPAHPSEHAWWRSAVIYQIYPRSFADANDDGIGDLAGITSRLPYLAELGIDAIWLSPFYPSPQADAGYDVSDYCDVDPLFGTLDDFDTMLAKAHALGLRVIIDIVPNHSSDEHPWFQAALRAPQGSPERERYLFRTGRGEGGEQPPNNWKSLFGGIAWTRVKGEDQWYLNMFDSKQPDFNWRNPEVRELFEHILRFWLDRGVDGFRVDVAHGLIKAEGLPDWDAALAQDKGGDQGPMWDQEELHDVYRAWHKVLNTYPGEQMIVAEANVQPQSRLARYLRKDELQQAFNFDYLGARWQAPRLKKIITDSLAANALVGAPTTWVMSNHDGVRMASRLGLSQPGARPYGINAASEQPNETLGLQRVRAAVHLMLALPGSAYIYYGEELGLPDHTTLDDSLRQDPIFFRTQGEEVGRDGCRIPMPWHAAASPSFGFSTHHAGWLPSPDTYARYAVDVQADDPTSTLALYRHVLALRHQYRLGEGTLEWLDSPRDDVLVLKNGSIVAIINFGDEAVARPEGEVVSSSCAETVGAMLPGREAVWIKQ